jgi:type II secretory ATPase GspE/PulE/Tfp pilus assembly ATPase PilB-like protein
MGREAVIELLHIDDQTRQLIYDGNIVTLAKSIDPASYQSFAQAARLKVLQGLTTTEEVERVLGRRFLNDRPDRPHQS